MVKNAALNLILNNSWSGSTIGYTGYNNTDCSKSSSFIYRLKQLIESDFFEENQIDEIQRQYSDTKRWRVLVLDGET